MNFYTTPFIFLRVAQNITGVLRTIVHFCTHKFLLLSATQIQIFCSNENRAMPLCCHITTLPCRPIRHTLARYLDTDTPCGCFAKNYLGYTTGTTVLYQQCTSQHKPLHEIHQQPPLPGATLRVRMHALNSRGAYFQTRRVLTF